MVKGVLMTEGQQFVVNSALGDRYLVGGSQRPTPGGGGEGPLEAG